MKNSSKIASLATLAFMLSANVSMAQPGQETEKIKKVIQAYETALNASDTDTVVTLYAADGVFLPQYKPSQIGAGNIRKAYQSIFKAITLDIKFKLEEIKHLAPNWAFARSNSNGFITINALGKKGPQASQELFLFQKQDDGDWKIARYGFSSTNPPRK